MFVSKTEANALVPGADYVVVTNQKDCCITLIYGKFIHLLDGKAVFQLLSDGSTAEFNIKHYEFYPEYDASTSIAEDDEYQ